jgi:DNA-directed RNA polymerases I, II, and III subunit RPABC2
MESSILSFDNNETLYENITKDKITPDYLTKYEYAKIIGISAQQIESGRKLNIKIPGSLTTPIEIAEYELRQKKTPFIIKRKLPNGEYEYRTIDELNIN